MGKRKGSLEETLSFAQHNDDSNLYTVSYRDKDRTKIVTLKDFLTADEFSEVPLTRILQITREKKLVWQKGQKQVELKRKE